MTDNHAPLFSVVIPTWNRADLVGRALQSVLSQTLEDFEVLIVDDGSTDQTLTRLADFADPRLRVVERPHEGVASARNAGARAARGEFLTFLDSDDEALPIWLEQLSAPFRRGGTDVAVCGAHFVDGDGAASSFVPTRNKLAIDDVAPRFWAGCAALRRQLFLSVGGFDPNLEFGENTELALRLLTRRPQPTVTAVSAALIRVHRREQSIPDYAVRSASARVVLDRHRHARAAFPKLWASYETLVGVECARTGHPWCARHHFARALRTQCRSREHVVRFLASLVPGAPRRLWYRHEERGAVLFIVLAPGVGGSVRSLATILRHIRGVKRLVARPASTSTAAFFSERRLADAEVDLPSTTGHRLYDRLRSTAVLTRAAWRYRHDLAAIHANGISEFALAVVPALVAACPIVVWAHEWEVPDWSRLLAPALRVLAPTASFAAVSESGRRTIAGAGFAEPARIFVVPNPIDPDDVCGAEIHDRLETLRVAYVGTPARYKGFHLLPGLVRATQADPVTWIVFAGPETMMPEVFQELRGLVVDLRGKVRDVRVAYDSCDAVVVPSLEESFGRVAAEAMANGLPVVASDLEALRDLLGNDEAGLLVPPGDVDAMAAALRRLAVDNRLRQSLGQEGRRRSRRFAPEPITMRLQQLYYWSPESDPLANKLTAASID